MLFCTTTTWNVQKLLSYKFFEGNVVRVSFTFFHCCSFSTALVAASISPFVTAATIFSCCYSTKKCIQGGLAARSGTEFTWSPQLRNSDEWNWVQIFLENKYGGGWRNGRTMSFCSVLSFPAKKYHKKVCMSFFNGPFGHQEAWFVKSSWVTSLIVIRDLGKFSYF